MKLKSLIAASTAFFFGFVSSIALAASSGAEYLVKIRSGRNHADVVNLLSDKGFTLEREIPELHIKVISGRSGARDLLNSLTDAIEYAEPNFPLYMVESELGGKELNDQLWGHKVIDAPGAWEISKGSRSVIVAVSDTGIRRVHPELQPNLWINVGESGLDSHGVDKSKNKIDDDGNGFVDDLNGYNFAYNSSNSSDDHFHGTHVAGTIGALGGDKTGMVGINWNVQLMSLKFLSDKGSGTSENGIRTILYAANNGAKVLNASWGGDDYSQAMEDAIKYAGEKGMIFVAAAGNAGTDNDKEPFYPAGYKLPNLISVAALGLGGKKLTGFSCYGKTSVHLAAPGQNIWSTFNPMYNNGGTPKSYEYLSGTSMAAPHVSGVLALIFAKYPSMKWNQVREAVLSSVTPLASLESKTITGGYLNARAALDLAGRLSQNNSSTGDQ